MASHSMTPLMFFKGENFNALVVESQKSKPSNLEITSHNYVKSFQVENTDVVIASSGSCETFDFLKEKVRRVGGYPFLDSVTNNAQQLIAGFFASRLAGVDTPERIAEIVNNFSVDILVMGRSGARRIFSAPRADNQAFHQVENVDQDVFFLGFRPEVLEECYRMKVPLDFPVSDEERVMKMLKEVMNELCIRMLTSGGDIRVVVVKEAYCREQLWTQKDPGYRYCLAPYYLTDETFSSVA